jgi:hypothetical protein
MKKIICFLVVLALLSLALVISIALMSEPSYQIEEINIPEGYKSSIQIRLDHQHALRILKEALRTRDFYRRPCYLENGLKSANGSPFFFGSESFYFPSPEKPTQLELSSIGGFRTLSVKVNNSYPLATANMVIRFIENDQQTTITVSAEKPAIYIGEIFNAHVGGMIPKAIPVARLRLDERALLVCIADFYNLNKRALFDTPMKDNVNN